MATNRLFVSLDETESEADSISLPVRLSYGDMHPHLSLGETQN